MPPKSSYPVGVQSLQEIDTWLRDHSRTPYLGGDRPNAVDCMIAPRLYHIEVAMKELKVGCDWNATLMPCMMHDASMLESRNGKPSLVALMTWRALD